MYVYNIKHKRNLFIVIVNVCVNLIVESGEKISGLPGN